MCLVVEKSAKRKRIHLGRCYLIPRHMMGQTFWGFDSTPGSFSNPSLGCFQCDKRLDRSNNRSGDIPSCQQFASQTKQSKPHVSDTSSKVPTSECTMSIRESNEIKETVARNDNDFWGFDSAPLALPSSRTPTEDVVKLASQKLASLQHAHEDHI